MSITSDILRSESFTRTQKVQEEGQIVLQSKKSRVLHSLRPGLSADMNSVEIRSQTRILVSEDGENIPMEDQLNIIASYQTSHLADNAKRIIESAQRFLSNTEFEVLERIVPSTVDPNEKAKAWLKSTLYHGLCGVPNGFSHDGKHYHTLPISNSELISGSVAAKLIKGQLSLNLAGRKVADMADLSESTMSILIDGQLLSNYMKEVIQSLQIKVENGTVSIMGMPVRKWTQRKLVDVDVKSTRLEDIDMGI